MDNLCTMQRMLTQDIKIEITVNLERGGKGAILFVCCCFFIRL